MKLLNNFIVDNILNRRTFLKSLTVVCGAVVVCPGELLKGKTKHEILLEKFRAAFKATKFKPPVKPGARLIIILDEEYYRLRDEMVKAYQGAYY